MKKINWEGRPSTKTPISADNLNLMQDNIEEFVNGYVLYSDEIGTMGNVILNDEIENYDEYEIQYYLQAADRKIQKTSGKLNAKINYVSLDLSRTTVAPRMQIINNTINVEGRNITRYTNMYITIDLDGNITNRGTDVLFNITKVTGYKY